MNKIKKLNKATILKQAKNRISKKDISKPLQKTNKLEKTPKYDYLDLSREEDGILIVRNPKGMIVRIIDIIFPR